MASATAMEYNASTQHTEATLPDDGLAATGKPHEQHQSQEQRPGLRASAESYIPLTRPEKVKKLRLTARKRRRNKPAAATKTVAFLGQSEYPSVYYLPQHLQTTSMDLSVPPSHVLGTSLDPMGLASQEWLSMLVDWPHGSALLSHEDQEEIEEKKKWQAWAVCAAEGERRRRVDLMHEIDEAEEQERLARREWAINAIEEERRHRISQQFLSALTSTQWFNETISSFSENYEVVCPYYHLGCKITCNRQDLERHLKDCPYSNDPIEPSDAEGVQINGYEVMCPNAIMGCTHSCPLSELGVHLQLCPFGGPTANEEARERATLQSIVILECEEERARRLADDDVSDGRQADASLLQLLVDRQIQGALGQLHREMLAYCHSIQQKHILVRTRQQAAIEKVRQAVFSLWPFVAVECFGSTASGFMSVDSDVDLVICFPDEHQELPQKCGVLPLLQQLAVFLREQHPQWLRIQKFIIHARVPVIKATAFDGEATVSLDITVDGPAHTGLATTEFVRNVIAYLPPIVPLVHILRQFLKENSLDNAYTGGLPSYGLVLLALLVVLQRVQDVPNFNRSRSSSPTAKSDKKRRSFTKGFQRSDVDKVEQFTWGSVTQQRQFGRAVARKMLGLNDELDQDEEVVELLPLQEPVLGELLLEFLTLYGEDLEPGKHGYSVRKGGFRFNVQGPPPHPQACDPLIIEDPVNVINNVGKNCYKISQLQKLFAEAHSRVMAMVVRFNGRQEADCLLEHVLGMSADPSSPPPRALRSDSVCVSLSPLSEPSSPSILSLLSGPRTLPADGYDFHLKLGLDDVKESMIGSHRRPPSLTLSHAADLGKLRPLTRHLAVATGGVLIRMPPRIIGLERSVSNPGPSRHYGIEGVPNMDFVRKEAY